MMRMGSKLKNKTNLLWTQNFYLKFSQTKYLDKFNYEK